MPNFGIWEWGVIFVIILLLFGAKNLPKVGQGLGRGIREFKDALSGVTKPEDDVKVTTPQAKIDQTVSRTETPVDVAAGQPSAHNTPQS